MKKYSIVRIGSEYIVQAGETSILKVSSRREAAKLVTDFDPQARDENVDYYVAKLDDLMKKFAGVTAEASSAKQESLAL